ncbi:MAG: hypothetical protein GY861_10310 [bacterium]|nr:hypothetical protein [bacterium]
MHICHECDSLLPSKPIVRYNWQTRVTEDPKCIYCNGTGFSTRNARSFNARTIEPIFPLSNITTESLNNWNTSRVPSVLSISYNDTPQMGVHYSEQWNIIEGTCNAELLPYLNFVKTLDEHEALAFIENITVRSLIVVKVNDRSFAVMATRDLLAAHYQDLLSNPVSPTARYHKERGAYKSWVLDLGQDRYRNRFISDVTTRFAEYNVTN